MGFLNNLGNTKKNAPLEQAKENVVLMEQNLQRLCMDLGWLIYQRNEKGEENNPAYQPLLQKIKQAKANRDSFHATWLQLQGLMECANCKEEIPYGSIFCSKCGKKAGEKEENDETVTKEKNELSFKERCTVCGEGLEQDAAFCTSCGTKRA